MKCIKRGSLFIFNFLLILYFGLEAVDNALSIKYELGNNDCISAITGFNLCTREVIFVGGFWFSVALLFLHIVYRISGLK